MAIGSSLIGTLKCTRRNGYTTPTAPAWRGAFAWRISDIVNVDVSTTIVDHSVVLVHDVLPLFFVVSSRRQ
eukprot:4264143-Pyramimonas_sp.AAC.1